MTTQKQLAAQLAEDVKQGTTSPFVNYLFETLPKAAHGKIRQIEAHMIEHAEEAPIGGSVEVAGPTRAIVDRLEAFGLEIELDAAGLAVVLHSSRGFVA